MAVFIKENTRKHQAIVAAHSGLKDYILEVHKVFFVLALGV